MSAGALLRALFPARPRVDLPPGTAAAARRRLWVEVAAEDLRRLGHEDLAGALEARESYSARNIRLLPEAPAPCEGAGP